jgi:tetratricopeptide (TPR) repeat protein
LVVKSIHLTWALAAGVAATAMLSAEVRAQAPTAQELARTTGSGNYLAGRQANILRDASAAAAYYRGALKYDPKNPELIELAFYSQLAEGNIEEAVKLADRLLQIDKNNRNARLVQGVRSLKIKQFTTARQQLAQAARGPVTDLAATLVMGWAMSGGGDAKGAVAAIDRLSGPDWYAIFKDLHAGLILDLAGNRKEAGKRFERAHKTAATELRVVQAYGGWLSRNGGEGEALKVFEDLNKSLPNHPLVLGAIEKLKNGEKLALLIDNAQAGAAEALYYLGAALARRENELSLANRGLAYFQLALYLYPTHQLALLSLADLYEAMKQYEQAVQVYARIPEDSPLKRSADIQAALDLNAIDKVDEATAMLKKLIASNADKRDAILALGNIERDRKKYSECADTYGKALATIAKPERAHWTIFYFRGICYERAKQWTKAEADLKKALELYPDEPHVLNYLGYSWVDQGVNLDEGVKMIKRSVEQRPDDGYIVDSLGWSYYRLGNFDEAVKQLERAVELKPTDPTINDHLGDAYWKVGRLLEARFQWSHARDLKPEPEDLVKIEEKLKSGLPDSSPAPTAGATPAKPKDNGG